MNQPTGQGSSQQSDTLLNRALPGRYIDLMRDGVTPADLRAHGDKAVWRALLRTAHSAQIRGWDVVEWECLILEDRNQLARQIRTRRDGRPKPQRTVEKTLSKAWDAAWEHRTTNPTMDRADVAETAKERAAIALDVAAEADNDLRDAERAVLAYAARLTTERGLLQVDLAWRTVMESTGLTERRTKNALRDLERRGLLRLVERGRAGGEQGEARTQGQPLRTPVRRGSLYVSGNPTCGTFREHLWDLNGRDQWDPCAYLGPLTNPRQRKDRPWISSN